MLHKVLYCSGLGEAAQATDHDDLVRICVIENNGSYSAEVGRSWKGDVDRHTGGHAGINGVSTLLQHTEPRCRCQGVSAGDDVRHSHNRGPV